MSEPPAVNAPVPSSVAADGGRAFEAELRLRPSTIFTLYAAVFATLCVLFQMQLGHFTLMPKLHQLDPSLPRYQLLHADYAATRVRAWAQRDELRIEARQLRLPGVAVVLRADKLFVEHDCPLAVPHRHLTERGQLVIAFEAKSTGRPAFATAQISDGRSSLYSAPLPLSSNWSKLRVPLNQMGFGGANFAELVNSRFLLVALQSESDLHVSLRNLRLLKTVTESH